MKRGVAILVALMSLAHDPAWAGNSLDKKPESSVPSKPQRQFPQIGRSVEGGITALGRTSPMGRIIDSIRSPRRVIHPKCEDDPTVCKSEREKRK